MKTLLRPLFAAYPPTEEAWWVSPWLLLPLLSVLPLFVVAQMMPADAPFGPILAMVVTALYAGLQVFLALLLLPCAMLFCRLVRRSAA